MIPLTTIVTSIILLTGLGLTNSLHLPSSNSSQTQNMPLFKALLTYLNQNFAGDLSQETDSNDPASISDCDLFREIYQETMEDKNPPNETYQNNLDVSILFLFVL